MGNTRSKENDTNAAGLSADSGANYTHSEAAEILTGFELTSRLELTFSAINLKKTDYLSKTDAFVVVSKRASTGYSEIVRTEIVANNLHPKWVKSAYLSYNFDEIQELAIEVYDVEGTFKTNDATKLNLGKQQKYFYSLFSTIYIFSRSIGDY